MYGSIEEGCDDVKKVMGELLSLFAGNGLCDLICELSIEINFKCKTRATHAQTRKYLWDDYYATAEITSDDNDTIVDMDNSQSELRTDKNHTYVDIS